MRRLIISTIFCISALAMWAVPARKGAIVKTQPDGTKITIFQHGDEFFHWLTNEKGEWIKLGEDGFYHPIAALSQEQAIAKRKKAPLAQQKVAIQRNIAPRGLVILVNFKDETFSTSQAEMDSMLTGINYTRDYTYSYYNYHNQLKTVRVQSQGSARQYFYDISYGKYNPQFDVIGPVTVSKDMTYYGQNDYSENDKYAHIMVKEACQLVDDSVDFSLYDNNHDGYVDFVYVIYAGYGEADSGEANTIWPHSWYLSATGSHCTLDGKIVDLYACASEIDYYTDHHTGIGTFCHEFSHVLGLPDLYTTDGTNHKTLGEWSILDYGPYNNDGNTPPAFSAYERFFMGWLTPHIIVDPEDIYLKDLNEGQTAVLISSNDTHNLIGNDPNPTNFYLLENRQQAGWDKYLPGHGLMLTNIRYSYRTWYNNEVNNTNSKMGVNLIEADGRAPAYNSNNTENGYFGKPTDLFPAGATEYLKIENHAIEDIQEIDGIISFKYKGGSVETATEEITTNTQVIAIYNILGQKQTTTDIQLLPRGTYVVVTTNGNKKIIR